MKKWAQVASLDGGVTKHWAKSVKWSGSEGRNSTLEGVRVIDWQGGRPRQPGVRFSSLAVANE